MKRMVFFAVIGVAAVLSCTERERKGGLCKGSELERRVKSMVNYVAQGFTHSAESITALTERLDDQDLKIKQLTANVDQMQSAISGFLDRSAPAKPPTTLHVLKGVVDRMKKISLDVADNSELAEDKEVNKLTTSVMKNSKTTLTKQTGAKKIMENKKNQNDLARKVDELKNIGKILDKAEEEKNKETAKEKAFTHAPRDVKVIVKTSSQVVVQWSAPLGRPNIKGYRILYSRKTDSPQPTRKETRVGNVLQYRLTGLKENTEYILTISGYNRLGEGAQSKKIWFRTLPKGCKDKMSSCAVLSPGTEACKRFMRSCCESCMKVKSREVV